MATNENVNKVIYGNQTVMDITDTTAEEADVASGEVFYKASGERSVGTLNKDSAVWGNIGGTLSDQTDLQIELNRAYTKTASETSSIDDLDLIPVQKISASSDGRRNIKFRNLKSVLKTYFDTIYSTFSGSYNDLSDKPTVDQTYNATSSNAQSGTAVAEVVEQIYADNGVLGAKNLLPNNATSQTINGVTFTVNDDGSVTANGTATGADASINLISISDNYVIPKGNYILSKGFALAGVGLLIEGYNGTSWVKTIGASGSSDAVNLSIDFNGYDRLRCRLFVSRDNTVNNLTFYPMLRLAFDPDDTYVPYAMTNRELTEAIETIPTVHNGQLTIQQNGTNKATFTANQNGNATANIVTDDWVATGTVSGGAVSFSGIDDSGNYGYKPFAEVTASSTNKNPTAQISTLSGTGTSSMSITYTTDADNGTTVKLRRIK